MVMASMRPYIRHVVLAAVAATAAACTDAATGPRAGDVRSAVPRDRPSLDVNSSARFWGFRSATFTLTSAGGTYRIGDSFYTLTVPANAVCSLSSSYGPGTWDSPCTTLGSDESITVTATYGITLNGPAVDFSPALRFSPDAQVTLSTSLYSNVLTSASDYFASHPSALRFFGMYYETTLGSSLVTDAATDPSLVTHVNLNTGIVWRRVKHFSGYSVATGLACDPSPDNPDCVEGPPPVVDQTQPQ
jgi:hypothetical protein